MSEVYAFEWCDCVFESGFAVESLHASKGGAYRAMRGKLLAAAEDDRDGMLRHGSMLGRGWRGLRKKAWRVRAIEVMP